MCAMITWWHATTQSEYDIVWCLLKGYVKDDLWRIVKIMWDILLVIKIQHYKMRRFIYFYCLWSAQICETFVWAPFLNIFICLFLCCGSHRSFWLRQQCCRCFALWMHLKYVDCLPIYQLLRCNCSNVCVGNVTCLSSRENTEPRCFSCC